MIQNFNYNGRVISQREDGFISLTQMCQANDKRIDHWKELKATKAYIKELLSHFPDSRVLDTVNGGNTENIGTWGHPSLAINLARWISPKFAVWCDAHIFNLMNTGQTSIDIDPIEEMKLKIEYEKLKGQNLNSELSLTHFRHTIVTTCSEPVQQKILGYQEIKVVEYRDRIIKDDEIIRDGSTLNKTQLCKRYGFVTKNGKPDYKKLNKSLDSLNIPNEAWESTYALRENHEFKTEYLASLDLALMNSDRQLYLGE